jgi:hypothetical protein
MNKRNLIIMAGLVSTLSLNADLSKIFGRSSSDGASTTESKSLRERLFGPKTPSSEPGQSRSLRERFGFGRKETSSMGGQISMRELERKLDEVTKSFEQKVREAKKNLTSSSLGRIKFSDAELKRVLSNIKQAQLSPADHQRIVNKINTIKKHLKELHGDILTVEKGGESDKGKYSETLRNTYTANFSTPQVVKFNIQPKAVYDFLGIGNQRGASLSAAALRDPIEEKLIQLTVSGRYTVDDIKSLRRQLNYIFSNDVTKKQYDNYLQGKLEVLSSKQKEVLRNLRYTLDDIQFTLEDFVGSFRPRKA